MQETTISNRLRGTRRGLGPRSGVRGDILEGLDVPARGAFVRRPVGGPLDGIPAHATEAHLPLRRGRRDPGRSRRREGPRGGEKHLRCVVAPPIDPSLGNELGDEDLRLHDGSLRVLRDVLDGNPRCAPQEAENRGLPQRGPAPPRVHVERNEHGEREERRAGRGYGREAEIDLRLPRRGSDEEGDRRGEPDERADEGNEGGGGGTAAAAAARARASLFRRIFDVWTTAPRTNAPRPAPPARRVAIPSRKRPAARRSPPIAAVMIPMRSSM